MSIFALGGHPNVTIHIGKNGWVVESAPKHDPDHDTKFDDVMEFGASPQERAQNAAMRAAYGGLAPCGREARVFIDKAEMFKFLGEVLKIDPE